jgi:hypothetical protein
VAVTKIFDMELFLVAALTGAHATRRRHLKQAEIIQAAIAERWQRETPWRWQKKHITWFLKHRLAGRSERTRYFYLLTVKIIVRRLGRSWVLN